MKKFSVLVVAMLVVALGMGCASQSKSQLEVPEWLNDSTPENAFWGVGIAKLKDESLALRTATTRARLDVAGQLGALSKGFLTDYASEQSNLDKSKATQFIESIATDLVKKDLSGAAPNARQRMSDGSWWVRVELSKSDARRTISDAIDARADSYPEFKAREALKRLDSELEKAQFKPTPRSED